MLVLVLVERHVTQKCDAALGRGFGISLEILVCVTMGMERSTMTLLMNIANRVQ